MRTNRPIRVTRAVIPNSVTAFGVFLGYLSILYTFEGNFIAAAWLIVIAGIIDLMDGRLARMVGGSSKFGGYFDSLADAINYGIAPSLLFYHAYFADWGFAGAAFSFLPTVCGAIRLAHFNVLEDESAEHSDYFMGLPTTVAAGFLASYLLFAHDVLGNSGPVNIAAGLMLSASLLMVTAVPYGHNSIYTRRSFLLNWRVSIVLVAVVTLALFPARALFAWIALYVAFGLIRGLIEGLKQRKLA